ncbi:hypothetical protein M0Q50_09910 [bacterium]|jgi:hypothetical protein|nr:hypothetical protein [bacterium]
MIFLKTIYYESGVFLYADVFEQGTIKRYCMRKDNSIHWHSISDLSDDELDVMYDKYLRKVKNDLRKNKLNSLKH